MKNYPEASKSIDKKLKTKSNKLKGKTSNSVEKVLNKIGKNTHYDHYTAEYYENLVGKIDDEVFQEFMQKEIELIKTLATKNSERTAIDLGAGYGRIMTTLASFVNSISIENNPSMFNALIEESEKIQGNKPIFGDMTKLSEELEGEKLNKPLLLLLQNTLGTINGDRKKLLLEIKKVMQQNNGEFILGLFKQKSLKGYGEKLYKMCQEMLGEIDYEKTDFKNGLLVTKTDYISKWWSDKEIKEIIKLLEGKVISQINENDYIILHIGNRKS